MDKKTITIIILIVALFGVLILWSMNREVISEGGSSDNTPKLCLNNWETSKGYIKDEDFHVKVYIKDLDKRVDSGLNADILSLPFGLNTDYYYLCEKERPAADICFINGISIQSNVLVGSEYVTNSIYYPEFETNQERYIKSFTVGCTCYYDDKLNMEKKYNFSL